MKGIPEVRISYSWLLDHSVARPWAYLQNQVHDSKIKLPDREWIDERVEQYVAAWKAKDQIILESIQEIFGLHFYDPVIKCSICPRMPSFSDPLVINTKSEPDEFVDILTHELLHILLNDNQEGFSPRHLQDKLRPDFTPRAKNHIFVHAGSKYVYQDVLEENYRYERDISNSESAPDYKAAWGVVSEEGHMELISMVKEAVRHL